MWDCAEEQLISVGTENFSTLIEGFVGDNDGGDVCWFGQGVDHEEGIRKDDHGNDSEFLLDV